MSELQTLDGFFDSERCVPIQYNPQKAAAALGLIFALFMAAGWGAKKASETYTVSPTLSSTIEESGSLKPTIAAACQEQVGADGFDVPASIDSARVLRNDELVSMIYDGPVRKGDVVFFDCTSFELSWLNNRNPFSDISKLLH